MYNAKYENQLIITDIADTLSNFTSIQLDIDETKLKAAQLIAQKLDLQRVIGKANIVRCINPESEADEALLELIIPPLCYFTYARSLKMFQGTLTDSGYSSESEADDRDAAKDVSNDITTIAETLLLEVAEFLEGENNEDIDKEAINPRIRVFGGGERRETN